MIGFGPLLEVAMEDVLVASDHKGILHTIACHFGISLGELVGQSRKRRVARPRQIAMYLLREDAGYSFPHISQLVGGRDHSTVMYGCTHVQGLIESDPRIAREIQHIRGKY